MKYIAKTMSGFEELLVAEINFFGGSNCVILNRAVSFEGDLEVLYKVNLCARTAIRVIKPILEFRAHNETVLYKRLQRFDWTELFGLNDTFKINSNVNSERFTHSKFIALKTKDAIVDQFRARNNGSRPSIDLEHPDYLIDIHCYKTDFSVSLDSSGESLHKRGFRLEDRRAPLNETLAAGMLMLSGWDTKDPLLDPMCGSGTILMEAAMMAKNIAPRSARKHFAFMNWSDYDDGVWRKVKLNTLASVRDVQPKITGYEIDASEFEQTKKLIQSKDIFAGIEIKLADFFLEEPPEGVGFLVLNPPYGIRLEEENINSFYKQIGDTLKQKYQGWSAWILSGNKDAIKKIGLRTSRKLSLYNGPIECKFHRYDLYQGSKKQAES